jgi:PKD domain/Secretion system C-terminal sorting domain
MKTTLKLIAGLFLLAAVPLAAQNGMTQQAGIQPYPPKNTNTIQAAPNNPIPLNGNGSHSVAYQDSKCGLNYVFAKQRLGQRFFPAGVPQPAMFTIAGIPATAIIERVFVWSDASGTGAAFNVTKNGPGGLAVVPSVLVGSDIDKCWGYGGSHTYRADLSGTVPNGLAANGNYMLSGFPVGPPDDIDGATLVIIYSDPTATFTGDLVIWDGAIVQLGVPMNTTMTGFTVCGTGGFNARAFVGIGDLQGLGSQLEINGVPGIPAQEDWWDWVDVPTTVVPGQAASTFGNVVGGDCYNYAVTGLYWQSNCGQLCTYPCEAKPDFKWDGCNPIQFQGANNGVSPVVSWFWDFGDGTFSNQQNPLHTYANAGSYKVCLTIISRGSDGSTCCDQICYEVEACPPPPCGVIPRVDWNCNRNNPSEIIFTDLSIATGGSVCSYTVDYGDGSPTYSGPTIPPHVYPAGSFEACIEVIVCVYDAFGNIIDRCSDKVCFKVENCIVISPFRKPGQQNGGASANAEALKVFPIPASSQLNIVVGDANASVVRIMNASGQEVMRASQNSSRSWQADISSLATGTYFVVVQTTEGKTLKQQFVKE